MTDRISLPIETKLFCLMKFGEEAHLRLLAEGKLRCRSLLYYKAEENKNEVFFDQHEGLEALYQANDIEIYLHPKNHPPVILNKESGLIGQVYVSRNWDLPVFCLHAIHAGEWTNRKFTEEEVSEFKNYLQIPEKMENNYKDKHVWVITNGDEFNVRLEKACKLMDIEYRGDLVRYIEPENFHGTISQNVEGFVKRQCFAHEREYRYIFHSSSRLPDPFVLDVGSLKDISLILPIEEFKAGWSIQLPK